MLFKLEDFYSTFQVNFYDYKQLSLKYILENTSQVGLTEKILEYKNEDFIRAIKSEIRQTYLHAIETTFELIFALDPDKNGQLDEKEIVVKLSRAKFPYDRINSIAENPKEALSFLDRQVKLTNDKLVSVGHFIFFRGLYNEDLQPKISLFLENIKIGLETMAKDFKDRREYNNYKHGLRPVHALREFGIINPETKSSLLKWDLKDSMTFFHEDKKSGEVSFITKVFDTERDLKMTTLCSDLIWNIISLRKYAFESKWKKMEEIYYIQFYKEDVLIRSRSNVSIDNLQYTIEPSK